mgnify:CR=1 FL=1
MRKNRLFLGMVALAVIIACAGCKTANTGPGAPTGPGLFDAKAIPFVPAVGQSALRFEGGSYPNLFDPACTAVWTGPELAPEGPIPGPPEAAPTLNPNFLSIECHLESSFSDISIAYDAVGLRGIAVYILTPDGRKVFPAQKIGGGGLKETPQGALRKFARNNTLIFTHAELALALNREDPGTPVRLMLEGYGSKYSFDWFPRLPDHLPSKLPEKTANTGKQIYEQGKKIGKDLYRNTE